MPKINNTNTPDGYEIGGPIDVISTQEELQKLWQRFEANFPKQERNEPATTKKGLIWYTTNGKSRRTRTIKLFEKVSMELGSLAGDVRTATRIGEPKKAKGKKASTKGKARGKRRAKGEAPSAETLTKFRDAALSAGDKAQALLCEAALRGNKIAIAKCIRALDAADAMR